MVAVSVQPSSHPGRSDFPSPVGGDSFHVVASRSVKGLRARSHTPSDRPVVHPASLLVGLDPLNLGSAPEYGCRVTAAAYRESLCVFAVLTHSLRALGTDRQELPRLHRSY